MSTVPPWLLQVSTPDSLSVEGAAFLVTATQALTCAHVVRGLPQVRVRASGEPYREWDGLTKIVADGRTDIYERDHRPGADIALINLPDPPRHLTPAPLGPPTGLPPGTELGAFGFPGDNPLTLGLWAEIRVSRPDFTGECYQVDSLTGHGPAISPGFSGGPAVDSRGRVVGMVTAARRHTAWIIPLTTLAAHWQPLASLVARPDPEPGTRELRQGVRELGHGEYDRAAELLARAVDSLDNADSHYYLALAWLRGRGPHAQFTERLAAVTRRAHRALAREPDSPHTAALLTLLADDGHLPYEDMGTGVPLDQLRARARNCSPEHAAELSTHCPAPHSPTWHHLARLGRTTETTS
ncbi:serine protease [Streptomyces sp. NPDC060366]|uniref:S1 family peptidase n=1 Tax=Streptomyces sp. NPDC060366 TaxID=3347105 RepID=UPI003668FCA1